MAHLFAYYRARSLFILACIAPMVMFWPCVVWAQPDAGIVYGTVQDTHAGGRFVHVTVERTEPAGLAKPGEVARVMARWARKDGKLAPRADDTALFQRHQKGDAAEFAVRRDAKHQGFRLTDRAVIEEVNRQARRVAETMFLPKAPIPTDASVITGADLYRLARLEAKVQTTIHVAVGDSVTGAMKEARQALARGESVRVRFAAGVHRVTERLELHRCGGGKGKAPMLVIEGAPDGKTVIDFEGSPRKSVELISLNNKHHVVIRNLAMLNHPASPLRIGSYAPVQDNAQVLIEGCRFEGNQTGLIVWHVNGLTIRNVDASRNARTGLFLIAVNAIIEDSRFTHNRGEGPGSFRGGIAFAARDTLLRRVAVDDNGGRATGLRMDHAAVNIIIEESTFNRNGRAGMVWETATGPVLIRRTELNDNEGSGIELATAYNFTLLDSELRNNGKAQLLLVTKPRPIIFQKRGQKDGAYGAADLTQGVGEQWTNLIGMMGNRFLTVRRCTLASPGPVAPFYRHEYGRPEIYQVLLTEQFNADGNTYLTPKLNQPLFDDFRGPYGQLSLIDFPAWQRWTGQDAGSVIRTD